MQVRIGLIATLVATVFGCLCSTAFAATPGWECVPTTAGQAVTSGGTGNFPSCGSGRTAVLAPTYVATGVGGVATAQFSGVNVQIVNGTNDETKLDSLGNLVIGYDTFPKAQTGSHNLLIGGGQLSDTSYGGIDAGSANTISVPEASVLGGQGNTAKGVTSSVSGGNGNTASGPQSTVTGGQGNLAADPSASITGGCDNLAGGGSTPTGSCNPSGLEAILGGFQNRASGPESSISGGIFNVSSGYHTSVSGGGNNTATDGPGGGNAWVGGGAGNTASNVDAAILGGVSNTVSSNCGTFPDTGQSC